MDKEMAEIARQWLVKARNDLDTARQLAALPDGHLDTAIYHCQQTAEKVLKGFLAAHAQAPPRTHDVERLISLASVIEPTLSPWASDAAMLTPLATAYRYPGDSEWLEPLRPEFDDALKAASDIFRTVLDLLPAEVRPS